MMFTEEHIEKLIAKETREELKQEYDIVNALLEFDNLNNSVFVDYLIMVEEIVLHECAKRYLKSAECEVIPLKLCNNK